MNWYYTEDQQDLANKALPSTIVSGGLVIQTSYLVSVEDWDTLASAGWYQEYREAPMPYQDGWEPPVVDVHPTEGYPVAYVAAGPTLPVSDIRSLKEGEIDSQVPDTTVKEMVKDPLVEADLKRELSAASDRKSDLEDTPDNEVEDFDTTLAVANPQDATVEYSDMALQNQELEPWPGAPEGIYGFRVELRILGDPLDGAEARVYVDDAPSDVTAVLPFVQDSEDPALWTCESRDGHKWSDPAASVSLRLLWGAGSLPVSPTLTSAGLYDRQATPVRFGGSV